MCSWQPFANVNGIQKKNQDGNPSPSPYQFRIMCVNSKVIITLRMATKKSKPPIIILLIASPPL